MEDKKKIEFQNEILQLHEKYNAYTFRLMRHLLYVSVGTAFCTTNIDNVELDWSHFFIGCTILMAVLYLLLEAFLNIHIERKLFNIYKQSREQVDMSEESFIGLKRSEINDVMEYTLSKRKIFIVLLVLSWIFCVLCISLKIR